MTKTTRSLCVLFLPIAIAGLQTLSSAARAQNVESVAQREIARRQAGLPQGNEALARAQVSMQSGDYLQAHQDFRLAVTYLPDAAVSGQARADAVRGFSESGVKVAERRVQEGKYAEAEAICREILSDQYNPNYRPAMLLLTKLREPGQINRTMGPKFIDKVEEVRRLLTDADGYYNSGRYDLAFKKYEQILNLDPYNTAARRGQEKINNQKTRYGEEAYNETRSRATWQVQQAWENPVRKYGQTAAPGVDAFARDATGTARISNKLNTIIIPKIEFRDASIREAMDFLRQQAAANDPNPEGRRGVDIVLRLNQIGGTPVQPAPASLAPIPGAATSSDEDEEDEPAAAPTPVMVAPAPPTIAPTDARITITLNEIPLGEALRYVASQAGLKVKVEPYAVSIIPVSEQSSDMFTKEYRVPPGFLTGSVSPGAASLNQPAAPGAPGGTGKDTQESTGGRLLVTRETAKDFLAAQGVAFPPGASANFLPQSSRLIVRNTQDNLELVDALVEQASVSGPQQVEIEAKFVEITQNNLKELGFDWLLGNFGVGGNKVRFGGGSSGTGAELNQADFPYSINSMNPVTAGNRSGNLAISANAIDSLLLGLPTGQALAPGIFGVGGLLTNPQFQVVMRALNQKKGVDLLSAPRVTTKSGQRAVIEIVREFRYPTQFEPPQIPQSVGAINSRDTNLTGLIPLGGTSTVPITPTTPTAFETRNTGVTLEVEPVVGPDGVTIDLNLVPQVVEFEGFINYGSPILSPSSSLFNVVTNALITTPQNVVTPNIINQPIFSTRKVTTSVSVWDGQTVVLGGLMREDVQKTEDRTPIIGDIPIVGRLFRSNAEQHIKRNLIIFVTARLINPGGQLVNQTDEVEETEDFVQPPELPPVPMYKK
jgi:general secretion pathway protein D